MDTFRQAFADWIPALAGATVPVQTVTPNEVLQSPMLLRVGGAFVAVLALGGILRWRYEGFLERSIDSSTARPVRAVVYGVAAHLVFGFAGVYLGARLGRFTVSGLNVGGLGLVVLVGLFLSAGALGFAVLGSTIVALQGEPNRWYGIVVGALLAAATMAAGVMVADATVAVLAWIGLVSFGIGGPVRNWVNASATDV